MAGKKLPKEVDFAAGFFSTPLSENNEPATSPTGSKAEESPKPTISEHKVNTGGRPKKETLKNEQYTLTMDPVLYEKLKIIAKERTRSNFSSLIDEAIKSYCREYNIDIASIEVESSIIDLYKEKQAKREKSKKHV